MRWLLAALILSFTLTAIAFRAADRSGHDFGAVLPAILGAAVTFVLCVVYVALVFWNHRLF